MVDTGRNPGLDRFCERRRPAPPRGRRRSRCLRRSSTPSATTSTRRRRRPHPRLEHPRPRLGTRGSSPGYGPGRLLRDGDLSGVHVRGGLGRTRTLTGMEVTAKVLGDRRRFGLHYRSPRRSSRPRHVDRWRRTGRQLTPRRGSRRLGLVRRHLEWSRCTGNSDPCKPTTTYGIYSVAAKAARGVAASRCSAATSSGSNSFRTGTTPYARPQPCRHRQPRGAVGRDRSRGQAPRHRQPEPVHRLRSGDANLATARSNRAVTPPTRSIAPSLPGQRSGRFPSPGTASSRRRGVAGPGRERARGPVPRRANSYRSDQLAGLQRRRPAHRAAAHHAVRQLRRLGQRHRARDRLRRLLRRRLEQRPLPGSASGSQAATSRDISSSTRRRIRGAATPSATSLADPCIPV